MPRTAQSAMLHLIEGNPNNKTKKELHKRLKNEREMAVSAKNMDAPAWLSTGAKKEFKRVVDLFKGTTVLNEADIAELALYADTISEYKAANSRLKKNGRSIDGKPNPDLRLKMQLGEKMDKYARSLALPPTARASLAINKEDTKAGDDDFE